MKKRLKIFIIFAIFAIPTQLIGQYTIKYNFHPHDPDSCIVSFVDTVKNEVVRSFALVEYSPYWNLPLPEIGDKERIKSKTFKMASNDTEGDVFKNFVDFSIHANYPSYCDKEPKTAHTYSNVIISNNKQFVIIPHYLQIYTNYCLYGQKTVLHIYNARGEIHGTIKSHDLIIADVVISDNGKYLCHTFGSHLDDEWLDWKSAGYRIIDIENDKFIYTQVIEFAKSSYDLYVVNYDNLIQIAYSDQMDFNKRVYIVFDPEKQQKYTTSILKEYARKRKYVTPEGFVFGVESKHDTNTVLLRFESDFDREEL